MTTLFRRAAAVLALLALALVGVTAPASAHDDITSSDPRDGQNIAPQHREFVITYSDKIQTFGVEAALEDKNGKRLETTTTVRGDQLRVATPADLPLGEGTLRWRVVSSDGHPIDGVISYTVVDPAATPSASASSNGLQSAKPKTQASDYSQTPGINWPLFIIALIAIIGGFFGAIAGLKMRKKERE